MALVATADAVRVNRRRGSAADGVTFWHTLYLGTSRYNMAPGTPDPDAGALFPMAFLVEQDPGTTANAHYHQQDQFQLVVGGYGTLGLHEVQPVTVHFTGAHTAYGPIRASKDEGVWYFTLRNGFDPGARFMTMPENRAALRTIPGRKHREAVAGPIGAATTPVETLLGPAVDGMAAWRYRLAPNQPVTGPDPATGRGQYWVVIKGCLKHSGSALSEMSCVFVYPDDPAFQATADDRDTEVIAMQFPLH
ncbi:MAG: hypothetical protein B7Z80_18190 [Rhodospirillales bacterium 20-64-7]|nr:MAG: hypothetical protein B7Z80_18190 [Rhodospirillales bacterium 20-64-7]HQT77763.1 hypothetical protein [Rhodopila sp.]